MAYYKNLREYLLRLEELDKLVKIKSQVNKDTQLHPMVRLQFSGLPEEQRKAFLFENVIDSKGKVYSTPVLVGALAGSSDIYATGMMCKPEEIAIKLTQAQLNSIEPEMVDDGAVHEEIHKGTNLLEHGGLDEFPIPISTPGYDCAPFFTAGCWVTKDPDTGVRNVAVYRSELRSPTRTGITFSDVGRHALIHFLKCKDRGVPLEAAIVVGGPPNVGYSAVSRAAKDVDEFAVAGGIAGEPLSLVKCKTVDLEVPAQAEVVVEGELNTEELELEGPFGENMGYLGMTEKMPYFTVKCITHRKNPIWLSFISQFPPSESSKMRQYAHEGAIYKYLKYDMQILNVLAVTCHESTASNALVVIQIKKTDDVDVFHILKAAGQRLAQSKIIVAVDEDINPRDINAVNWAIGFRIQPHRDCHIVRFPAAHLMDPSLESTDVLIKKRHAAFLAAHPETPEASRLLIDATLKWPYPPVSLPKKEFMEEALRLWEKEGLPDLKLNTPWWGYELGYWDNENKEWADLAVKGEYYQTGEIRAQNRIRLE
ncbi:UbiD family decarboxylase [Chloroflexota bacterium]